MGEVGVGYDGSPESDRALELGRLVAAEHHAKVSAFQAVSTPAYPPPQEPPGRLGIEPQSRVSRVSERTSEKTPGGGVILVSS